MTTFDLAQFDTASGRRLQKSCNGCDPGAELTFIPELMYFGYSQVDASSDWQPFMIKNTGIVPVGVESVSILEGEFELDGGEPFLLVPGEIATLNVRFSPLGNGSRIGNLQVKASIVEHLPLVGLVGIGGALASPSTGGAIGGTPESAVPWAYRYGNFIVDAFEADEILLDYHVTTEHRLQSNFAGCRLSVGTPPTDPYVLSIQKNGVQMGTITINPDGSFTRVTNGGLSILFPLNSIVTVKAPAVVDPTLGRLRMTFVGVI